MFQTQHSGTRVQVLPREPPYKGPKHDKVPASKAPKAPRNAARGFEARPSKLNSDLRKLRSNNRYTTGQSQQTPVTPRAMTERVFTVATLEVQNN